MSRGLRIATQITPLLDRPEEEVHDVVEAWECYNVPNKGREIPPCTTTSLHDVAFDPYLFSRER